MKKVEKVEKVESTSQQQFSNIFSNQKVWKVESTCQQQIFHTLVKFLSRPSYFELDSLLSKRLKKLSQQVNRRIFLTAKFSYITASFKLSQHFNCNLKILSQQVNKNLDLHWVKFEFTSSYTRYALSYGSYTNIIWYISK